MINQLLLIPFTDAFCLGALDRYRKPPQSPDIWIPEVMVRILRLARRYNGEILMANSIYRVLCAVLCTRRTQRGLEIRVALGAVIREGMKHVLEEVLSCYSWCLADVFQAGADAKSIGQ